MGDQIDQVDGQTEQNDGQIDQIYGQIGLIEWSGWLDKAEWWSDWRPDRTEW